MAVTVTWYDKLSSQSHDEHRPLYPRRYKDFDFFTFLRNL